MRSITFISAVLAATSAMAELPMGCFQRVYSAKHIAAQPAQVVAGITLHVYAPPEYPGNVWAGLSVTTTDVARTRAEGVAGQTLTQSLSCWEVEGENMGCSVDCDGGYMEFVRVDDDSLTFSTNYLWVGDTEGCGGALDISEGPGDLTRYRLNRVDPAICEGL